MDELEHMSDAFGARHLVTAEEATSAEAALCQAEQEVASMTPSVTQRRIKQMLTVLRRAVDWWSHQPPSARQLSFINRLIGEALREATYESAVEQLRRSG